jgi:hypothetical protein
MSFQQIQDKLNQTFTGQASLAAATYAGKMDALTIASGNAKEIIGRGLTDAITSAFGGGDINKATTNIEKMGQVVADIVAGLGTMVGFLGKIGSWSARNSNKAIAEREGRNRTPYDPMSAINPGLTPAFMKNLKDRQKADALAAKRQKELAALAQKQTKAIKEQTALTKAKAVLDKSSAVLNMDLIQNTAALMGKITEDESLRLRLQQAILLGNSEAAGGLAQQLLSSQIAAMKLSSTNPLGGFSNSLDAALQAARQLRNELAMMGAAKVPIPDPTDIKSLVPDSDKEIKKTPENPLGIPSFYGYSGFGQSFLPSKYPTEIVVSIDPSAAALGITSTVITNSANGNSNGYNSQQSFAGGMGL